MAQSPIFIGVKSERVLAQLAVDECNELYCELVRRIRQLAEKEEVTPAQNIDCSLRLSVVK